MSTSVAGVTTNFFPDAENGFTTTTAGSVASGATTVTLASVAGYTNGLPVVFVIDPSDVTKKQTFTGVIDTAGVQVTSVVWTAGTNQTHALGATVVDYPTATHMAMISKGLTTSALDQDGTLKAGAVDVAGVLASDVVTTAKILDSNVTAAKVAAGMVVQMVTLGAPAVATGTTTIPIDDTIPQITEGNEYMTLAITPKSATNVLVISVVACLVNDAAAGNMIGAIFQDATAGALAANTLISQANQSLILSVTHTMTAGTTSATTFRFRAGLSAAGTTTFNGRIGARIFGAIPKSSITIIEYKA